jgi:outer membrane lipoprotein-sorting protein
MKLLLSAILIASLVNGYGQASNMSAEEAAKAYNEAALKYFGEFAKLNVVEEKK